MFSMLTTQKLSTHCIWRLNEPGRSVSESFLIISTWEMLPQGHSALRCAAIRLVLPRSASLAWRAKDMCGPDWLTMCLVVPLHNPLQGGIYI